MLDSFKMAGALAGLMKNKEGLRAAGERIKATLAEIRATGTSGGGAVTVTCNGQMKVLSIQLSPALASHMVSDSGSKAIAENLIVEATNAAIAEAQMKAHREISKEAEALGLPNMPGLSGLLGGGM